MTTDIENMPITPLRAPSAAAWDVEFATPAMALLVGYDQDWAELPLHEHASGQLIIALSGAVMCHVPGSIWIVPSGCAVWVPAGLRHRSPASPHSRLCILFVKQDAACLPLDCCTLEITPLVRELVLRLVGTSVASNADDHELLLMKVLLRELEGMPTGGLRLPVSSHPKMVAIQEALMANPADRTTLAKWSSKIATSERTLARLVFKETGMTFGRWRQQLHLLVAVSKLSDGVPVQQVSHALGYESTTAFITMFRKALGTTPSRYFDRSVADPQKLKNRRQKDE
ncbi:AraC family transcriptional regulator [Agrobacterium tumefaciens]|uniref:AraC family transcriptional regulator n=1 Tax=Agrobacterium tumefaciens TaxID=358 RepID=UPI001F3A0B6A|nr:helix-turn-helix transcriptional regulator [Agrobacterium tumefaciens]